MELTEQEALMENEQLAFVETPVDEVDEAQQESRKEGWTESALLELQPVIEAVLFTLGRAVEASELAKACGCETKKARKAAALLQKRYEEAGGAVLIREYDGKYQMCTNPKYYENLIHLVQAAKKPVLTEVVLETLSIIAYKHPTTKVEIEKIRGVKSDHAVNKLIEYGLVEEVGRLDAPGRPALFAPAEEFYRRFGVRDKEELPRLDPEAESRIEEEVKAELKEALGESIVTEKEETKQKETE